MQTSKGRIRRGSGYPITPNRIITAAHVIADAAPVKDPAQADGVRDIRLSFGPLGKTLDSPVCIEWDGRKVGVDVAVLRCELPADLQPNHSLLTTSPSVPIGWFAQGYTDFGKQQRQDASGQDDYRGELTKFFDEQPTVALECRDGPLTSKKWAGGSGSVAFDLATATTALAVITEYQGGKKLDELKAVPLCYLLNSEATQIVDDFRHAIRFDLYEQQEDYRNRVIEVIAKKLEALGEQLWPVVERIRLLLGDKASGINPADTNYANLARNVADGIVNDCAINEVVGVLVGLMEEIDPSHSRLIADIIDHLLPLNYAPHIIHRLREQLARDTVGLVENEVATRTLAEIIMAGYDQQATLFAKFRDGDNSVRGQTAFDYDDGPEEGPSDSGPEMSNVLRETRNFLYNLLTLKDEVLTNRKKSVQRRTVDTGGESDIEQEIVGYATRLRGPLTAISRMNHGRTVYCVLRLPMEASQRAFRKKVLSEVRQLVPQLVFVELVPDPTDEREFELEAYLQASLIRTQQGNE